RVLSLSCPLRAFNSASMNANLLWTAVASRGPAEGTAASVRGANARWRWQLGVDLVSSRSRRYAMRRLGLVLFVLTAAEVYAGAARAENLSEAISAAYKFNPRLDAARAMQRATDEEVPRALSGYRPQITGEADTSYQNTNTSPKSTSSGEF